MPENWLSCQTPGCRGQTLKMDTEQCPVCGCNALKAARPLALTCQQCKTSVAERGAPAACPTCGGWLAKPKKPKRERAQEAQQAKRVCGVVLDDFVVSAPSVLGLEPQEFDARFGHPPEETFDKPWKLDVWLKQRGLPTLAALPADAPKPKKKRKKVTVDANEVGRRSEEAVQRLIEARGGSAKKTPTYQYKCMYSGIMKHASTDVDLDCMMGAHRIPIEVKGISVKQDARGRLRGAFKMDSISTKERGYLNKHLARAHPLVALLWWDVTNWQRDKGTCDLMHLIPWAWWIDVLEPAMLARAKGNFKGKSLRYHADLGLLDCWKVERVGTKWDIDGAGILMMVTEVSR